MKKLYVKLSDELFEKLKLYASANGGGNIHQFVERAINEMIIRDEQRKTTARETLCILSEEETTPSYSSGQWLFDDEKRQ